MGLLGCIDRKSFHPLVVLPSEGELARRLRAMDLSIMMLPLAKGSKKNPLPFLKSVCSLTWLIRKNEIDLVHANHEFTNRHAALASRFARVPQICHVRNAKTQSSVRDHWLRMSPFLIANSRATARSYESFLRHSQRSYVVYNGVDLDRFSGDQHSRHRFGIPEDAYVIAQVGRITPEKGIHILLESLTQIVANHPEVHALVAGDTTVHGDESYLASLRQQVAGLHLGDRIRFVGYVGDVQAVYGIANLLVQPSICVEGFGRSLIEAMAMRLPVVASGAGGAVEVVDDGVTGLLIPPNDASALARAILTLMENRALADRMGQAGRERVERLFTNRMHAQRIQAIYHEILGR